MDSCPIVPPTTVVDAGADARLGWGLSSRLQVHGVSALDRDGTFTELRLQGEYAGWDGWVVGLGIPVGVLHWNNETDAGLGNPVPFVDRVLVRSDRVAWTLGLQIEVPLGSRSISDDHFELMPYTGVQATVGPHLRVGLQTGLRVSASGFGHDHDGAAKHADHVIPGLADEDGAAESDQALVPGAALAYPHSGLELTWLSRLTWQTASVTPSLIVDGQQVLESDAEERTYVTLGMSTDFTLSPSARLSVHWSAPVTETERYGWRAGMGYAQRW